MGFDKIILSLCSSHWVSFCAYLRSILYNAYTIVSLILCALLWKCNLIYNQSSIRPSFIDVLSFEPLRWAITYFIRIISRITAIEECDLFPKKSFVFSLFVTECRFHSLNLHILLNDRTKLIYHSWCLIRKNVYLPRNLAILSQPLLWLMKAYRAPSNCSQH